jgi:hypothetical protein
MFAEDIKEITGEDVDWGVWYIVEFCKEWEPASPSFSHEEFFMNPLATYWKCGIWNFYILPRGTYKRRPRLPRRL